MTKKDYTIDTLTKEIDVLTRREVEARILIPVIDALEIKVHKQDDTALFCKRASLKGKNGFQSPIHPLAV